MKNSSLTSLINYVVLEDVCFKSDLQPVFLFFFLELVINDRVFSY